MNLISIFGAGLLVGAALIVILPEGMYVLYKAQIGNSEGEAVSEDINKYVGASLIVGFLMMLMLD
jgi:zinc transporter 9